MPIFQYGDKEIEYLKRKDKRLAEAIDRIGPIKREVIPDLFEALINNIVCQQISTKAGDTVWMRMREKVGRITPENLVQWPVEDIQKCGMSMRKASYIKDAAEVVLSGKLKLNDLESLPDDELCKELSALKGIGVWTAEMLMIFSMQRPDIVSWNDLAIRRGMMMLYRHRSLDKETFNRYKKRYSPYGSVASLYLWEISAGR